MRVARVRVRMYTCARARVRERDDCYCVKSFGNDAEWQLSRRVSSANPMQYFTWTPYDAINKVIISATRSNGEHKADEIHSSTYNERRKKDQSRLLFKETRPKNHDTSVSACCRFSALYLSALAKTIHPLKRIKFYGNSPCY